MACRALSEALSGTCSATAVAKESLKRAAAAQRHEWIYRLPEEKVLEQAAEIDKLAEKLSPETRRKELPLLGTTFAVKDNISVKGVPSTNGCDYTKGGAPVSGESADAVRRVMKSGAVLIGTANMDCAATGLVGVRSAYGACKNSLNMEFVSGGSSSGSAVAVATGQVSFAFGTDTAGSGRVPAMFNNIVGLKASRGLISTHGVAPACRSLDCVSVFASTVREAWAVLQAASTDGQADSWDRAPSALAMGPRLATKGPAPFVFAVPSKEYLDFFSFGEVNKDRASIMADAWEKSIEALKALGGKCVEIDYSPFSQAAKLLYEGPWVAERFSALKPLLDTNPNAIFPTVRDIVEPAAKATAQQTFESYYKLKDLKAKADSAMAAAGAHVLVTPTAGTIYKIAEVEANPIVLNSNLGRYTNHMNLLDMCGIAVPTVMSGGKLPFGVTISAPAGHDGLICDIGGRLHLSSNLTVGAMSSSIMAVNALAEERFNDAFLPGIPTIEIAVSGAHMEGLVLNWQLAERGARFLRKAQTAPVYRLLAFDGMKPPRPGLAGAEEGKGKAVELEVWELPIASFGSFMKLVAAPLGIGWVELEDGTRVQGFRLVDESADKCGQPRGGAGAPTDITSFGGWRGYLEATNPAKRARL